ncbi:PREDICTED: septin-9 [Myotis davidii]|uniref:septin-9 n=1 Tax=Myotis davidii TaxID=225400 RepID=UPI000767B7E6|nr:PREDICTED: septin-9 [Myotis davidii]
MSSTWRCDRRARDRSRLKKLDQTKRVLEEEEKEEEEGGRREEGEDASGEGTGTPPAAKSVEVMERDRISALKRSFEVEEVDTPNSTPPRRVQTPLLRATVASSTQKFQDLGAKNSEPPARHIQVPKSAEVPAAPAPSLENSEPAPLSQLQSRLEPKPLPPSAEAPPRSQEGSPGPAEAGACGFQVLAREGIGRRCGDQKRQHSSACGEFSTNEKAPVDFGYVGIDSILEQMRRKAMKQGFEFNIMVVGQSGLGKSTLINTLFKSKISRKSVQPPSSEERIPKTIEIKSITHDIEEKGVRMKLTVIDTPGFGDHINNENCLRPLDIEFMKRLSKVVNIVPVIAKADTLTLEERVYFKQRITADLLSNGIDVYPQKEFDEDAEDRLVNEKFREMIPFAVVGSDHEYQVNGKRILGRKTKWGTIEVENIMHCEFAYLRDLLIR